MTNSSLYGRFAMLSLVLAAVSAQAIVPDIQRVANTVNELKQVVRVYSPSGAGTGTIFDIKPAERGMSWVCVLTADHVLRNNVGKQASIGFGSRAYGSGAGTVYAADPNFVWWGGDAAINVGNVVHNPDIGVVGVKVPNAELVNVTKSTLVNDTGYTDLTAVGYGTTGVLSEWTGGNPAYVQDLRSYGTKRFANNEVDTRGSSLVLGFYRMDWFEFDLDLPAGGGEGAVLPGDSGGPSFISGQIGIDLPTGGTLQARTVFQPFVNTYVRNFDYVDNDASGTYTAGDQIVMKNGSISGGVSLNADYNNWIDSKCEAVPEPGAFLAFGAGLAMFIGRRRRR